MFTRIRRKIRQARNLARFLYVRKVHGLTPPADTPYFEPAGVDAFKAELAKASSYLEFGSGGSTVLADRAGIPAVSVESDAIYAKAVRSRLTSGRVRLVTPDIGMTGEWGTPLFRSEAKWRRYVEAPFPIEPFPDFVLVDGRFRVACALKTAQLAFENGKSATLMFDDYMGRPYYHEVETYLREPKIIGRAAFFQIGLVSVPQAAIDLYTKDCR